MPYLRNGQVVAQRSAFRPSIVSEFIWKLLNIIGLFFGTLSAKTPTRKRKKETGFHNYRRGGGGGGDDGDGGGGGPRRPRGGNIHTQQSSGPCNMPMGG